MVHPSVHKHPIEIELADIDFMGHVNNANYLKWVQIAVLEHWQRIGPADAVAAHRWIAVRHEITYRKPAFLGDELIVIVQLKRVQRESAFYEAVVRRGEDILAEVQSRWCCVDAETLRPARVPPEVVKCFLPQ